MQKDFVSESIAQELLSGKSRCSFVWLGKRLAQIILVGGSDRLFGKGATMPDLFVVVEGFEAVLLAELGSASSKVCGAEDLHLIGIPELADNIISLMSKNGPTGEIKAAFKKRLRFEFNQ